MSLRNLSDEELMARYQLGSEEAFSLLYERHSSKVYGFVRRRIVEPELAAEVFQEVFVKMHKSKHLYNTTLPLLPWLFSISRSVVLDWVRSDKRKPITTSVIDMDQFPRSATEAEALSLDAHLSQLPSSQRAAVQLRYVDEKTFDEIASVLNTSPLNARKLISRATAQLRELVLARRKP